MGEFKFSFFAGCWYTEIPINVFPSIFCIGNKYPKVAVHEFKAGSTREARAKGIAQLQKKEMSSVDWNLSKFSDQILASCWDGTVST